MQVLARIHWPYTGFTLNFALIIASIIVLLVSAYFSKLSMKEKKLRGKIPTSLMQKKELCWMVTVMMLIVFSSVHLEIAARIQSHAFLLSWVIPGSIFIVLTAIIWYSMLKRKPH